MHSRHKDFKEGFRMKVKGKNMKNRMPAYIAGIAMFAVAMAVAPGSIGAILYNHNTWSFGLNDRVSPAIAFGPRFDQPVSGGRPVANTYSGGTGTLTLSGDSTYFGSGCVTFSDSAVLNLSGGTLLGCSAVLMTGTMSLETLDLGSLLVVGNNPGILTLDWTLMDGTAFPGANLLWPPELLSSNVFNVVDWNNSASLIGAGLFFDFPSNIVFTGSAPIQLPDGEPFTIIGEPVAAAAAPMYSGNSAILTVIPEPASAMMLLFGAGVGLAVHRARRGALRR